MRGLKSTLPGNGTWLIGTNTAKAMAIADIGDKKLSCCREAAR